MDVLLAGILLNLVSSKIYDTARHGYKKVTDSPSVQKAIRTTSEKFTQFDALNFALSTWCGSDAFEVLVERLRVSRMQDVTDASLIDSFIQQGGFYSEDIYTDARAVLHTFMLAYQQALYESDQGPAIHAMRDFVDHARTHEGIEHIEAQSQQLMATMQQILQRTASLPGLISDPTSSIDASEQSYQVRVEVARSQLLCGKPKTARSILNDLERDIQGKSVSDNLHGRIKGNLGACALALEEVEQATNLFREALVYLPDNPKALSNAALMAFQSEDMPETIRLATLARKYNAHEPMATALYLHALQLSGQAHEVSKLLLAETWINTDPICTLILAEMRFDEGKYTEAEALLGISIDGDAANPVAYGLLAQVILASIQNETMQKASLFAPLSGNLTARMHEAETALSRAIELLEQREIPTQLRLALLNRSNCRRWAGKFDEAISDCDRILQSAHYDTEALRGKAATLLQDNRYVEAIACYERLHNLSQNLNACCGMAYALLQTNQPAKAENLLSPMVQFDAGDQQIEPVALLIEACYKMGDAVQVENLIQHLSETKPDDPDALAVIAEQSYREGNVETAKSLLHQALDKAEGNVRERTIFRLAKIHYDQNEFADAALLFGQIVDDSEDSPIVRQYLISLLNSKSHERALSIAQSLRGGGKPIPVISEVEARVLEYIHCPKEARDLWLGLSREEPKRIHHLLRAVIIDISMNEHEAARQLIESIPYERIQNDAKLLMQVAETRHLLQMPDALPLAYQARRIGDDRPEVHLAYVNLFLHREDSDRFLLEPQIVSLDSAVHLRRGGVTKIFVIVDDKPINHAAGERSPTDPLSKQLLGKRKGEQVTLKQSELEEIVYEIVDIQSKYVYAFQQTLTEFSTWFPDYPGFYMVSVENNDFSKMFKMLDDRHNLLSHVMQVYRENNLPLASIAKIAGNNIFDVWAAQIALREGRVIAATGNMAENAYQSTLLTKHTAAVLETTAIFTICYLDMECEVRRYFADIYVAQPVLDEMRKWLYEARNARPSATMWREGEKYFSREIQEEDVQRRIRFLERIENLIVSCTVVPVPAMLTVGAETYQRMADLIGESATTSMLIAKERGLPLYSDDLGLRLLAQSEWEVQGIWTQQVLMAVQKSTITEEQYFEATKQLALANYFYLSINADSLIYVLRQNSMTPTEAVIKVFAGLKGPICTDASAIHVAAAVIRMIWLERGVETRKLAVLDMLLGIIVIGRDGRRALEGLKSELRQRMLLMPIDLQRILAWIDTWAAVRVL